MASIDDARRLAGMLGRDKGPDASDLVNYAASKTLDQMLNKLTEPNVTPKEFNDAMGAMKNAFKAVFKEVQTLRGVVDAQTMDPVLSAIKSLEGSVNKMTDAVMGIRIPETKVPAFPEIPQPKEVDLRPILASQDNIVSLIAAMGSREVEHEEREEREPRNWVFDVQRNQSGLIRKVEVNET